MEETVRLDHEVRVYVQLDAAAQWSELRLDRTTGPAQLCSALLR